MRFEVIVKIFNDDNKEMFSGDKVKVLTNSKEYTGTIKKILPKSFSLDLGSGKGVQILFKDVMSIM